MRAGKLYFSFLSCMNLKGNCKQKELGEAVVYWMRTAFSHPHKFCRQKTHPKTHFLRSTIVVWWISNDFPCVLCCWHQTQQRQQPKKITVAKKEEKVPFLLFSFPRMCDLQMRQKTPDATHRERAKVAEANTHCALSKLTLNRTIRTFPSCLVLFVSKVWLTGIEVK